MVLDVFDVVFDEVERDFRVVAEFAELNAATGSLFLNPATVKTLAILATP